MNPELFRADLDHIPDAFEALADSIATGQLKWPVPPRPRRVLLLGMGSSYYAAATIAQRLRAADVDAVAELASATLTWPPSPDLLVVAISATGSSAETLGAAERHHGVSRLIALTNDVDSPLAMLAAATVNLHAGREAGGVACRTYRHTLGALLELESQLVGGLDVPSLLRRAALASSKLLDTAAVWLDPVLGALDSPDGTWFLAPVERWSSALQSALMIREGPRRRADGCETGDWSHVDVYLTKPLDYRAVVYTGSAHDGAAAEWMRERRSTVVAVGGGHPSANFEVRFPHDHQPLVGLLTEVLVAEIVAATWWASGLTQALTEKTHADEEHRLGA